MARPPRILARLSSRWSRIHQPRRNEISEVGRLPQHRYGAYDPSPVVSSRSCLASSTDEPGTSTSLGPADRKSGASKPAARWISDGMPASFSTPSISSATVSSGAAATFTHLSAMDASYPRLFTEARRNRILGSSSATLHTWYSGALTALAHIHTPQTGVCCDRYPKKDARSTERRPP